MESKSTKERILIHPHDSNGFPTYYTEASMIAAISVAIGNTYRVEVKHYIHESAIVYMYPSETGRPDFCNHPKKAGLKIRNQVGF